MKKKITTLLALVALVLATVFAFAACGDNTETPPETVYRTVTFDLAGGTLEGLAEDGTLRVKDGTTLSLADYVPEKDGYTFAGYKIGDDPCDGNITLTEDITLVATWTPVIVPADYTVTFDPAGGSMEHTTVTVREGTVLHLSDYVPVWEGRMFEGWIYGDSVRTDDFTVVTDVILKAKWSLAATPDEKFIFTPSGDGKSCALTGLAEGFDVKDVIVPGEYNGCPVTEIGAGVFAYQSVIESIDLRRCTSLTVIGKRNFYSCENLESVLLDGLSALTKISDSCFVSLPEFMNLGLHGLTSLEEIGDQSFTYGGIQMTYMPIEVFDFSECTALKTIGKMSFWNLSALKVMDLSSTALTGIGSQFLLNCDALEVIALPATLTPEGIGSEFFGGGTGLREIRVAAPSPYLTVVDGVLYDTDMTTVIKAVGTLTSYTAPATLKVIRSQAFLGAASLTVADLTACALREIGWQAFADAEEATLKVSFTESGKNADGTAVTLGNGWNRGVKSTEYGKLIEFTVTGITNGGKVSKDSITMMAAAMYGAETCDMEVLLNGTAVTGENGAYVLSLVLGENTVVLRATHNGQTAERTLRVTRVAGDPTVTTTLPERVLTWKGAAVTFTVTAKDAAGNPLGTSAIEIRYDWGYGEYKQDMGVTMTENADGTVTVTVSYDDYSDWGYLDGDTEITLTVFVKDGELSASVSYTVDWREKAPELDVTTTLENGTQCDYDTPLTFTVTAKDTEGNALTSAAITLKYNYGYGSYALSENSCTMTDNGDGTVGIEINFGDYAGLGYFDYEDKDISVIITVKDGNLEKVLTYTVHWVEN